jgi:hypothetical protein
MTKIYNIMNEYYDEETQEERDEIFFCSSFNAGKNLSSFVKELSQDFSKVNFNKLFDIYFHTGGGEVGEANEYKKSQIKLDLFS